MRASSKGKRMNTERSTPNVERRMDGGEEGMRVSQNGANGVPILEG